MNVVNRMASPTPPFFKKVRNTGLALATIAAGILSAPVALPAILLKIAGYAAVAGSVASTVSQAAVQPPDKPKTVKKKPSKKKQDVST